MYSTYLYITSNDVYYSALIIASGNFKKLLLCEIWHSVHDINYTAVDICCMAVWFILTAGTHKKKQPLFKVISFMSPRMPAVVVAVIQS